MYKMFKDLNQWEVKWWEVKKKVLCMGDASKEVWMSLHKTSFKNPIGYLGIIQPSTMCDQWNILLCFSHCDRLSLWNRWMFCNWSCNSNFELQRTLVTHCIYTLWVLTNKLHELQNCNSLYIWCNSLQLNQNNSFSTTMQFHYNCTHDVMLIALIIIHLLDFDMWHYEDFWT